MFLTMGEKIKIILKRRNMSVAHLAEKLGQSPQNFNNKLRRDNFSEKEMLEIAKAMDCTLELTLTMNDTGDKL